MQAMASQQKNLRTVEARNTELERQLTIQGLQLAYVARLAGVTKEVDAIKRQADIDNPAQPVPNPPSEAPVETTEQAATPEAYDNPNQIGQTPGANQGVAAETTATPMDPGVTLPTAPFNQLLNVSAPVAGTETHTPPDTTRIETDVRVGDPMNPETAYPLNPAFGPSAQQGTTPPRSGEMSQTGSRNRTLASMRLARHRITAGLARGDEFAVAASIESDRNMSEAMIRHEIATLSQVTKAAARQARPQGLVPRAASNAPGVQRTMPSLVTQPAPITSVAGAVGLTDEDAESLFD
jgi:hypothetical protein